MRTGRIVQLGTLAVGLGIGAAIVSTPGVASADSSRVWLSSIDSLLGGVAVPAGPTSTLDLAISIDGHPLVSDGSAAAYSGTGDIAIAYGAGSWSTSSRRFSWSRPRSGLGLQCAHDERERHL